MLISNVTGTKGVLLFPELSFEFGFLSMDGLVTDGAFLLFPLAYVLGDVISEVYGFKAMRRVVLSGFGKVTQLDRAKCRFVNNSCSLSLTGLQNRRVDLPTRGILDAVDYRQFLAFGGS